MKSKKIILGIVIVASMALGVTAYATDTINTTSTNHNQTYMHDNHGAGLNRATGMRGYDYVKSVLINKLGMTEDEITTGLNSGKTMFDLAKEKGMTEDEFKTAVLDERNQGIDKAVAAGTITKESGDSMKETLKNNMASCSGVPGQKANMESHNKSNNGMLGTGMNNHSNNHESGHSNSTHENLNN